MLSRPWPRRLYRLVNDRLQSPIVDGAPQWSMDAPFALTIRYDMSFSTDDFVSRAKAEMKHVDPTLSDANLEAYGTAMQQVFPPVKDGDEITALFQPGKPVQIFKNGNPTGDVREAGFAEPFFGIWLSPRSSSANLRKALLHL